jgi:hypothetical protein
VTVAVQRQGHRGVPQELLHKLGMVPSREQQCGTGVPEVVEADVWQSGSFEEWLERSPGYVVGVKGPPAVGAED